MDAERLSYVITIETFDADRVRKYISQWEVPLGGELRVEEYRDVTNRKASNGSFILGDTNLTIKAIVPAHQEGSMRQPSEMSIEQRKHVINRRWTTSEALACLTQLQRMQACEPWTATPPMHELARAVDRTAAGISGMLYERAADALAADPRLRAPLSTRGIPLLWSHWGTQDQLPMPILTAECYPKWYALYLVSDEEVCAQGFDVLEGYQPKGSSAYVDHCPNPEAIHAYCEKHNYSIDPTMLYCAEGMWAEVNS